MDFIVQENISLLDFILRNISYKSKTKIRNMIKSGRVSVDAKQSKIPDAMLHAGQKINIIDKTNIPGKNNSFNILFEDKYIIVAEKPSGLLSISTDKENKNTFYRFVSDYVKQNSAGKEKIFIVHRLDRDVSGIMIFAKNPDAKEILQKNWSSTTKKYYAVVEGKPPETEGKIESWLKESKSKIVYVSSQAENAYFSVTEYRLLTNNQNYNLLEITISTGRKNQIRVQLAQIGCPVAGDIKYGAKNGSLSRICLHSAILGITHPVTKEYMAFHSEIPLKMLKLINKSHRAKGKNALKMNDR